MVLQQIIFWFFASILVISSLVVISSSYPIRSILSLVVAFVAAAFLWVIQGAEFLGLALIFVYVGAVMTLFLFVIMMLHQSTNKIEKKQIASLLAAIVFIFGLFYLINYLDLPQALAASKHLIANVDNTHAIGIVLYKDYLFEFELAAFILLVGMVAAIALTFRGKRAGNKAVAVEQQLKVSAKDRLHFAKFED